MKIPVLTYHSIDASRSVISTAPENFRRQMKFLSENHFQIIALSEAVENFRSKKEFAPKTIALTFDDGFQNFFAEAFPVLEYYKFTATVFLVTDFCGKTNDWAGNPPILPRCNLLAWREIKELNERGIEFGAHTRTHPDLTKISAEKAGREITESKAIIEEKLGSRATVFAYPYGKYNDAIRGFAAENFAAACSVKLGTVRQASDFYALERIDSYYLQNPKIFNSLSSKVFNVYLKTRRSLRNLKKLTAFD